MGRVQARKQKRSGKKASNDPHPSQTTTLSVTPTSSFTMDGGAKDGSAKENKQVSLVVGYISMTNINNRRYQTRSIISIGFFRVLLKASK